jgi:hypothetical protein
MASKRWMVLSSGRIKRWKQTRASDRQIVPPHWFRNALNRKDRRKARGAIALGADQMYPFVHPHTASWYW